QVLTYGSRSGTFAAVNTLNLPGGLSLNPAYNATNLTLVVGQALQASAPSTHAPATPAGLTAQLLAPVVEAAVARWAAAGLDSTAAQALRNLPFRIDDLAGSFLGFATPNMIWIDQNANGQGWFIDVTPADDVEFDRGAADQSLVATTGPAAGGIDL